MPTYTSDQIDDFITTEFPENKPAPTPKPKQNVCPRCNITLPKGYSMARHNMHVHPAYHYRNLKMSFGKHKGKKVLDIMKTKRGRAYLEWCLCNVKNTKCMNVMLAVGRLMDD